MQIPKDGVQSLLERRGTKKRKERAETTAQVHDWRRDGDEEERQEEQGHYCPEPLHGDFPLGSSQSQANLPTWKQAWLLQCDWQWFHLSVHYSFWNSIYKSNIYSVKL